MLFCEDNGEVIRLGSAFESEEGEQAFKKETHVDSEWSKPLHFYFWGKF